jgi:hypothetical protein
MTKREIQKRLIDLSVITISAVVLGSSFLLAAQVDSERKLPTQGPPEEPKSLAQAAPVEGLVPAPIPKRRVVVVRRSRAS